ncbi:hypothetical protein KSF_107840 [Reticulibacter mediterranei]|uniref:Uncharacterized protein n=1 Tax=Reticulibacter mediterranei TaxID=2778369 RepID=A0A8J3ITW9_9CHLR|nr:DUF4258 domain-containing protein [Reticulibacter mediterranei]GHP00737.1 hypothetical protein KSF_107840 [Reticulibacter mediterranei]
MSSNGAIVMEYCQNKRRCRKLAEEEEERLKVALHKAEKMQEKFLLYSKHSIYASAHAIHRMQERAIHPSEVHGVIECGFPIDFAYIPHPYFVDKGYIFTFCGEGDYGQSLHVICSLPPLSPGSQRWILTVRTVYDPSLYPEEWNEDFTRRVCFCYARPEQYDETSDYEL